MRGLPALATGKGTETTTRGLAMQRSQGQAHQPTLPEGAPRVADVRLSHTVEHSGADAASYASKDHVSREKMGAIKQKVPVQLVKTSWLR